MTRYGYVELNNTARLGNAADYVERIAVSNVTVLSHT